MNPAGAEAGYFWGDENQAPATYSVAAGQAVVVNCGQDLAITIAGQVPTEGVSFVSIADNNFTGNPFPAAIDIQDISIDDGGAGSIGWGTETFSIWEGVPTVAEGSEFVYWDASMNPDGSDAGCFWGDENQAKVTYSIPSGKGVVISCPAGLTVSIKSPYSL